MAYIDYYTPRRCWRVRFTISLGRIKKEKSRYPKTEAAANSLRTRLEDLERASRDGMARDSEIRRWIDDGFLEAHEAAIAFRAWAETDARSPRLVPTDYESLLDSYEDHAVRVSKAGDPNRKTHNDTMSQARLVVAWLREVAPHLPDITLQDCQRFLDELVDSGKTPSTVSHYITKLRLLLDRAVEQRMIGSNPARELKVRQPRTDTTRRILTEDEVQVLLRESLKHMKPISGGIPTIVRLGLYAGLRDEEMCWANQKWLNGRILTVQRVQCGTRSWTPKDRESRRLDVKPALVEHLGTIQHGGRFYLHGRWSDRPIASGSISREFKKFIEALGMDSAITIYSFRHTYATVLLRKGVDLMTVSRRLGHASISTTEKYLHEIEPEKNPTDKLPW